MFQNELSLIKLNYYLIYYLDFMVIENIFIFYHTIIFFVDNFQYTMDIFYGKYVNDAEI